jgi:16S rRNA (cytidine1402-2'-O)-methyltransferase
MKAFTMAGTLFVVATPIGNLEDISARAVRVLRGAALIAAEDTRHTRRLLQRFGIATRTTSFHEHSEKGKADELLSRLQGGESIALVSDAGTPAVSDPGQHLIRLAHEAGIRVEPIPGPSAVIAAVSASGFAFDSFLFLGFPPTSRADRDRWFDRIERAAGISDLVVFYEAPHRVESTLAELHQRFGALPAFVARELTKAHETLALGSLPLATVPRGEFTIVLNVGHIAHRMEPTAPGAAGIAIEFGELTKSGGQTRRQAITALSRKYRMPARDVFAALEAAKNSVG